MCSAIVATASTGSGKRCTYCNPQANIPGSGVAPFPPPCDYVRASEFWHLNVAFGISHNVLASDILSYGERTEYLFQNTYRRNGGYRSLLANIGMEYRTEERGHYYIGTSLHLPWTEISRIYPEYDDGNNTFNDENFNDKFFLEMSGNFITIDLRYFFPE